MKRVMDLNYVAMQPVVAAAQEGCEAEGAALVAAADANATKLLAAAQAASFPNGAEQAKAAALAAVGLATTKHAEGFVARWRGLLGSLFVAFKNGYNNTARARLRPTTPPRPRPLPPPWMRPAARPRAS